MYSNDTGLIQHVQRLSLRGSTVRCYVSGVFTVTGNAAPTQPVTHPVHSILQVGYGNGGEA